MNAVASSFRRGAVSATAMIPAVIAVYVFFAWATDQRLAAIAAWVALIGGALIAALVPASERIVARVADVAGQPISGIFVSMYMLSGGLGYLIGGLVIDEPGAILGGAVICSFALLPVTVGRFLQPSAPGLWLVYALVLSVAAAVLLPAFGAGLLLMAPAAGAWMTYADHRVRRAAAHSAELTG